MAGTAEVAAMHRGVARSRSMSVMCVYLHPQVCARHHPGFVCRFVSFRCGAGLIPSPGCRGARAETGRKRVKPNTHLIVSRSEQARLWLKRRMSMHEPFALSWPIRPIRCSLGSGCPFTIDWFAPWPTARSCTSSRTRKPAAPMPIAWPHRRPVAARRCCAACHDRVRRFSSCADHTLVAGSWTCSQSAAVSPARGDILEAMARRRPYMEGGFSEIVVLTGVYQNTEPIRRASIFSGGPANGGDV